MLRKTVLIITSAAMLITMIACGKKQEEIPEETNPVNSITYEPAEKREDKIENTPERVIVDVMDEIPGGSDDIDIDFLYEMEGYWVRPEGYNHLESDKNVPDEFIVNSETGKWKPYIGGAFHKELSCSADITGLCLTLSDGDEVIYAYDGIGLLNSDGTVAYVRVDSIPQ